MTVVEMENICLKIDGQYLLRDFSVKIEQGESWAVLGANGSGKTTLLSIMAGVNGYDSGKIKVLQTPMEQISNIRQKICWVSCSYFEHIYRNESVMEVVLSGMSGGFGLNKAVSNNEYLKAINLLEQFKLITKKDNAYCTLSMGEKQKTLLLRGLMSEMELILLDEPTSGLDKESIKEIREILQNMRKKRKSIIIVTHEPQKVKDICMKALYMEHGKKVLEGDIEEVLDKLAKEDVNAR